jgi:hypothetical protein
MFLVCVISVFKLMRKKKKIINCLQGGLTMASYIPPKKIIPFNFLKSINDSKMTASMKT